MNLFASLDDPTQEKLTAFIHMQEKRQHRPLREHMATWILEAIVDGNCEITGYAVNQHDSKVWTEFTFYKAFEKRDGCEGEWWENSDPGEKPGTCWECSVCNNSFGLDAGWVQFFEYCPTCGARLNTAAPERYAEEDAVSEYLAGRMKEDRTYFQMLQYHADAIVRRSFFHEGGPTYCERREAIDRMRRAYLHSGSGGMEVDYEGKPKGLELYSRKKRARILRTWTEVYDMLCAIVMQQAQQPGVDSENDVPAWQTGEPAEPGWYCCWAQWVDKYKGALPAYDPDYETLFWNGSMWTNGYNSAKDAGFTVHYWYPLPPEPDQEG